MRNPRSATRDDGPRCSLGMCDGSGFVIDEHTNTARDCDCRPQLVADARARHLRDRVPRRYVNLSWDRHPLTQLARDPLTADAVHQVRRYCADISANLAEGRGLWLMGHTGTGKTTLGYMIAATATQARHSVLSFNAVALLNRIRATFDSDSREKRDDVIRTLAAVELLHIEDLRVAQPTEWVLEQLYLIVNMRYEEQRSIVFTSDIGSDEDGPLQPNPRELADHVGARTYSRLLGMSGDPMLIMGTDKRIDFDVPGVPLPKEQTWDPAGNNDPPTTEQTQAPGERPWAPTERLWDRPLSPTVTLP
ncbi:MAG TPA: ATP-binding protein [Solirubrobacteraceae bacterium]|jgi:DNA replication protein DnaC|nr:ATP-binding protein [Solirubrobacteraceae bacterium]